MKKNLLLITLLALLSTITFAQNRITFSVRGGLNYSTISGDPDPRANPRTQKSQSPKIGFNLGVSAVRPLNDKMAIQAELFYSREGFKGSEMYEITTDYTQKYSLLKLPVFFKYSFAKNFYVMGGPQVSYLLAATYTFNIKDGGGRQYDEGSNDIANDMNKFGIGFTPSVGYTWKKFNFDLRYYAGLTRLVKNEYDIKIKSQVFSVVVGYTIFSGKK